MEKYFYYKSHPEEEPPEELKRKLSPKDAMDRHGSSSEDNEEEGKVGAACACARTHTSVRTHTHMQQLKSLPNKQFAMLAGV